FAVEELASTPDAKSGIRFAVCLQHLQRRLDVRPEYRMPVDRRANTGRGPKVFRMPRTQFFNVVICDTIWARATSSAHSAWQSRPFTVTSRYQPTRMICARPRASLASVLLTLSDSAPGKILQGDF